MVELSLTFLQILRVAFLRTFIWESPCASFKSLCVSRLVSISFWPQSLLKRLATACVSRRAPCMEGLELYEAAWSSSLCMSGQRRMLACFNEAQNVFIWNLTQDPVDKANKDELILSGRKKDGGRAQPGGGFSATSPVLQARGKAS